MDLLLDKVHSALLLSLELLMELGLEILLEVSLVELGQVGRPSFIGLSL